MPLGTVLLWITINATNCTDGVDGLSGVLTLVSLTYIGAFLYIVVGHAGLSRYLLLPHNPDGARWAILVACAMGTLGGYLWHNAEPSRVLMGDAGSRFLGLLVGVAVLAAGNPFLIIVMAPVVLVNGGTGLAKVALLRGLRKLGFVVVRPGNGEAGNAEASVREPRPHVLISMLHSVRFPLHDHCRKNLHWSGAQVLMRFVLIQAFLTPLLLVLLVKMR
jgi:phospho-N-acetylmuramoyl-pentapeptide-transferase